MSTNDLKTPAIFDLSVVDEVQIAYKPKVKASQRPKITQSQDVYNLVKPTWEGLEYFESFKVLFLNRANSVLGLTTISKGGISGTVADPKMIFQASLLANASAIILLHNHPSGNLQPSEADRLLTRKINQAGTFLEIPVLDHIIITEEGYFSFADEGAL